MDLTSIEPGTAKDVLNLFPGYPTKGMLMKLCEHGAIEPHRRATGTGSNRLFDWYNLVEIAIWRELHFQSFSNAYQFRLYRDLRSEGLNQKHIFEATDFIVIMVGINIAPQASVSRGAKTRIRVQLCSRKQLLTLLSDEQWPTYYGILNGEIPPKSMVIIDLSRIKNSLEDYFSKRGG